MSSIRTRENCRPLLEQALVEILRHKQEFLSNEVSSIVPKTLVAVNYAIRITADISDSTKSTIVTDAVKKIVVDNDISEKALFAALNRSLQNFLNQPLDKFIFVTHISLLAPKLPRRKLDGSSITFSPRLRGKFRQEFERIRQGRVIPGAIIIPEDYQAVKVSVSARTPDDAFEIASNRFDFIRGLWNLHLDLRVSMRVSSGGYRRPINRLLLLPFFTVHNPDGTRAKEGYWYELHHMYVYPPQRITPKRAQEMIAFELQARKRLRACNYRDDIKSAVVRYVRALDDPDYHNAFIKLWSLLEALAGVTDSKTSIKDVDGLIASLFSEPSYNEMILNSLRRYRNSLIHRDEYSTEEDSILWATKVYVAALLKFHIDFGENFSSIAEAMEFLRVRANTQQVSAEVSKLSKMLELAKSF